MKTKLLALALLTAFTLAIALIPDPLDRMIGWGVLAAIVGCYAIIAAWDWVTANWADIKFVMTIPIMLVQYAFHRLKERRPRVKPTPEEEVRIIRTHFEDSLFI